MTEILFSFVIPVHNRAHTICYCLDSILCQADVCNYEIIVVDDASTDNTPTIIQKIADSSSNHETQMGGILIERNNFSYDSNNSNKNYSINNSTCSCDCLWH